MISKVWIKALRTNDRPRTAMSTAGTTIPSRTWLSSRAPNYTAGPAFETEEGDEFEKEPDLFQSDQGYKYDPKRPGGNIFQGRTFNTFKKQKNDGKKSILKGGIFPAEPQQGPKNHRVRFSTESEGEREIMHTSVGGVIITSTKPYESIIAERDALLETEAAYRRRIQKLEADNTQILLDYETLYKENNSLRDKIDKGEDNNIESFQRVYNDRQILREAETAYKKRISQLEQEATGMLHNFESLYQENKVLRDKAKNLEDRLNAIDRMDDIKKVAELEKKVKHLEKIVRTMGYEKEDLRQERHEFENQVYKLREEIAEMSKRNLMLDNENEGLKRGFMALGKNADNIWKDETKMRTRRQEEEERLLKDENNSMKKQIDEIQKALHNLEKKNVELTTKVQIVEKDRDEFRRKLFDFVHESGKATPPEKRRQQKEAESMKDKKLEDLANTLQVVQKENVEMKTRLEMLNKENQQLLKREDDAKRQPRETASSIRRKMETEREVHTLSGQLEMFKEKNKKLEVEITYLKEEMKRMEIDAKAHKETEKALLAGQLGQKDDQVKELNSKIISLNDELKSLTEKNLLLMSEKDAALDKLQAKLDALLKDRDELIHQKDQLQDTATNNSNSNIAKIEELQSELNVVQTTLNILQPKHDDLNSAHETLKEEKLLLEKKLAERNNEMEQMKEAMRNDKDVYNELAHEKRENLNLRREIDELTKDLDKEKSKMETDLDELLKNQEFMNTALAEHKVRLDMLQREKNELKSENLRLVKANERQAKSVIDLKADLDKIKGEASTITKTMEEQNNQLTKELKINEKELIKTRQELEITKNERENQVSKLLKQMEKLKSEREAETKQLKDQSDDLRSEVARLKIFEDKMQNMENDLKDLIDRLSESEKRNKAQTDERLQNLAFVVKEMKDENLANRIRTAQREENEIEKHRLELEIKQDAINEIKKLRDENKRLVGLLEDKRAAEEAQDEWTKKKNKFNEVVAQNKRLEDENQRLLSLMEQKQTESYKKDTLANTARIKLLETQLHKASEANENLKKLLDEKEVILKQNHVDSDNLKRLKRDNKRLTTENEKLVDESSKKDHTIAKLKELETTKAKFEDSSANNQRLYEENKRLRETLENATDYKTAYEKAKGQEKSTAKFHSKYVEENTLLRKTLQEKELELRREIDLHKDRANNIQARNKRLTDEIASLKVELSKKDNIILKMKEIEQTSLKFKDSSAKSTTFNEENQRSKKHVDSSSPWRGTFMNASTNPQTNQVKALYVNGSVAKEKSARKVKLQETRKASDTSMSVEDEMNLDDTTTVENKMKIKPLLQLPDINKDGSGLKFGLSYKDLHKRKYSQLNHLSDTLVKRCLMHHCTTFYQKQVLHNINPFSLTTISITVYNFPLACKKLSPPKPFKFGQPGWSAHGAKWSIFFEDAYRSFKQIKTHIHCHLHSVNA